MWRIINWLDYANGIGWWEWAKNVEWLNTDRKQILGIVFGIVLLWVVTQG